MGGFYNKIIQNDIDTLMQLPSAQPELIEQSAYVRGFEQGRTQGMIDAQGGEEMNKQRKVVITITYNEMGIIIDTKAEELGSSAQPEQYTKEELKTFLHALSLRLLSLRSAQRWIYDDKTAEELIFLSHLYKKVEADMERKE